MTWLLCDYGEVLSLPQPAADKVALEARAAAGDVQKFWAEYWTYRPAYDRADLTAREYWGAVTGGAPDDERLGSLVELDTASWLHPNRDCLEATARAAARGLRLALFSNAPLELAVAIDGQDWLAGFSPRLFSSRLRVAKPEPAAFEAVLNALAARSEEVIFLDDRPANVSGALAAGMRAIVFQAAAQIDTIELQPS